MDNADPSRSSTPLHPPAQLPPPIAAPPPKVPPLIPTAPPSRKGLGPVTRLIVFGLSAFLILLFGFIALRAVQFARYLREHHEPTRQSYFYAATARIGPSGNEVSGNSSEAEALAKNLGARLASLRQKHFSQVEKKSLLDKRDTFKVHCDLREDQCVFLVHVPELRRFQGEAQDTLGGYAWTAAQDTLKDNSITNGPMKLAVALRGMIAYERVMTGRYLPQDSNGVPGAPEIERGFGCEKCIVGWLAPAPTNSSPVVESKPKVETP